MTYDEKRALFFAYLAIIVGFIVFVIDPELFMAGR